MTAAAIVAYAVVAVSWFALSTISWADAYCADDRRATARSALMAPVWPLALLVWFVRLVIGLWRDAR